MRVWIVLKFVSVPPSHLVLDVKGAAPLRLGRDRVLRLLLRTDHHDLFAVGSQPLYEFGGSFQEVERLLEIDDVDPHCDGRRCTASSSDSSGVSGVRSVPRPPREPSSLWRPAPARPLFPRPAEPYIFPGRVCPGPSIPLSFASIRTQSVPLLCRNHESISHRLRIVRSGAPRAGWRVPRKLLGPPRPRVAVQSC